MKPLTGGWSAYKYLPIHVSMLSGYCLISSQKIEFNSMTHIQQVYGNNFDKELFIGDNFGRAESLDSRVLEDIWHNGSQFNINFKWNQFDLGYNLVEGRQCVHILKICKSCHPFGKNSISEPNLTNRVKEARNDASGTLSPVLINPNGRLVISTHSFTLPLPLHLPTSLSNTLVALSLCPGPTVHELPFCSLTNDTGYHLTVERCGWPPF